MRRAEIIFDAITNIREELIDAALDHRFAKKVTHWQRYVSIAACLALVVTVGFAALQTGLFRGMGGGSNSAAMEDSVSSSVTSSSSAAANSGSTQESAPEDYPLLSDGAAAEAPKAEQKGEPVKFGATVLQVEDGWILVEPLQKDELRSVSDRFMVSVSGAEELPELKEGCEIVIFFNGFIRESYPPQIDAISIKPLMRELGDN